MTEGRILYAREGDACVIKLVGCIRYTIGARFEAFIRHLFREDPPNRMTIDMTATEHIDSTNLGLLARLARYLAARVPEPATISTDREDILLLLETMGFDHVFNVRNLPAVPTESLQDVPDPEAAVGAQSRTILMAHQTLMAMNENNRAKFRDVVRLMEEQTETVDSENKSARGTGNRTEIHE